MRLSPRRVALRYASAKTAGRVLDFGRRSVRPKHTIKINGNTVDPLAVKLPRANSLPQQYQTEFASTVAQVRALIEQHGTPVTPSVTVAATEDTPATTASN